KRARQVASPFFAAAPVLPPEMPVPRPIPSPQSRSTRWRRNEEGSVATVRVTLTVSVTLCTAASGGRLLAILNLSSARLACPALVEPEINVGSAPKLLSGRV